MSVFVNIPEVVALRKSVEEKFVHPLVTHNSFFALSDAVFYDLHEHISESTLERLWGYSTRGTSSVSVRTLDVLSRYTGAKSWDSFINRLKEESPRESEEFTPSGVSAADLEPGDMITIGWLPDRQVQIKYLGNNTFEIEESLNSSLRKGDRFECLGMDLGKPLFMDRFRRAGSGVEKRYVAGERNGLTMLVLPNKADQAQARPGGHSRPAERRRAK